MTIVTAILVLTNSAAMASDLTNGEAVSLEKSKDLIRSDIESLARLKFSSVSKAHMAFFGSSSGSALAEFINERTKRVEWAALEDGAAARASGGTLMIDEDYAKMSQLRRWTILIHESRHNETAGWDHVECPTPYTFTFDRTRYRIAPLDDMSGKRACDNTANGAYGVGYAFLQSIIENCTNCTEEMKHEAAEVAFLDGYMRILNSNGATELFRQSTTKTSDVIEENHIFLKKVERILNKM